MNKKILISAFTVVVIGSTFAFPSSTQAFWPFDGIFKNGEERDQAQNRFPYIIQKIIDKFGLNADEVEDVMNEAKNERQTQIQQKQEEYLQKAVDDEKITEEQKSLILEKHQEMAQNKENWQELTPEERKNKMTQWKADMQNWTEENGIDLKTLAPIGRSFKAGFSMGRFHK